MRYAIGHVTQNGKNNIVDWRLADFLNDLLESAGDEAQESNRMKQLQFENEYLKRDRDFYMRIANRSD